jgi:DNA end-binding protein Ku
MDMAMRLVEDMADEWRPEKYKDTFRDDLMKRIEEKVKAGQTEEITAPEKERKGEKGEVIDLMSALKKSLEKKPAKRAAHHRKRRAA